MNQRVPEMTVEDLKARLDRGEAVNILDVREPNEVQICRIEGSTVIPLAQLPSRASEPIPTRMLIVHCKMGGRSAQAVAFLRQRGFSKAYNLAGGILAGSTASTLPSRSPDARRTCRHVGTWHVGTPHAPWHSHVSYFLRGSSLGSA